MKWTYDKPTKPGWYWAMERDGFVTIYHIGLGDDWDEPWIVKWAGPIPKPED